MHVFVCVCICVVCLMYGVCEHTVDNNRSLTHMCEVLYTKNIFPVVCHSMSQSSEICCNLYWLYWYGMGLMSTGNKYALIIVTSLESQAAPTREVEEWQ